MDKFQQVVDTFRARFGGEPTYVVRAPGRVNLIGEHTDYNDGFVMPMAIDRAVWIALRPRPDKMIHLHALDAGDIALFDISDLLHQKGHWSEYVRGVAWALREAGFQLGAFEGVMSGDVPLGAGLSSSAALELATARSFAATSGLPWHPPQMARLSQRAENEWVGVNCGIMDQFISTLGEGVQVMPVSQVELCVLGDRAVVAEQSFLRFCVLYPEAVASQYLMQQCVLGRRAITTGGAFTMDLNFDQDIRVQLDGALHSTGSRFLGSDFGHRCRVGTGFWMASGRMVPNDYFLVRDPARVLSKLPPGLADQGPLVASDGVLRPVKAPR